MIGILHLGAIRPTPGVLRDVVMTIGEDARAGRYGSFTLVVSSEDDATRGVISDMATVHGIGLFLTQSSTDLEQAEPAGALTTKDRETLDLVMRAGGTITAAEFADTNGVEATTAGNRLNALHRKGYLQRVKRPHPVGDQFIDVRSVNLRARETQRDSLPS